MTDEITHESAMRTAIEDIAIDFLRMAVGDKNWRSLASRLMSLMHVEIEAGMPPATSVIRTVESHFRGVIDAAKEKPEAVTALSLCMTISAVLFACLLIAVRYNSASRAH